MFFPSLLHPHRPRRAEQNALKPLVKTDLFYVINDPLIGIVTGTGNRLEHCVASWVLNSAHRLLDCLYHSVEDQMKSKKC